MLFFVAVCHISEEDTNVYDVRHIEDLFISKYRINVAAEASVDEKKKEDEEKESPVGLPCRLFYLSLAFFLFVAYRWSIYGSGTVYLKKRSLIDSSLVVFSTYESSMQV
jgi:hypothetical protein